MNPNNNIFNYATGELSQDAFLCWLFSYAMKDADEEPLLKECAIDFLRQFDKRIKAEENVWLSEPPKKQYESIDILLTVNDKYKIIIEDKTYTSEHNDQLKRYLDTVKEKFSDYEVIGVYFKTGFQSDISNVLENEYFYCDRETILKTLEKYFLKSDNLIFNSYYEKIKKIDDETISYKQTPCCEWNWSQIYGFYSDLKKKIDLTENIKCNYGYVNNKSGGFYGMWIWDESVFYYDKNYELYLQCEFVNKEIKICYKANSVNGNKISGEIRKQFIGCKINNNWSNIAEKHGFIKPNRYGAGKAVTLGVYCYDCEELYFDEAEEIIKRAFDNYKELVEELNLLSN